MKKPVDIVKIKDYASLQEQIWKDLPSSNMALYVSTVMHAAYRMGFEDAAEQISGNANKLAQKDLEWISNPQYQF